ncbi:MAG TPA: glycolate oxidase subunit GlcF [Burkholderiales bacterium]|nr:glycolate oxidase subunit GlcF [Burkholderiales bacterium]
MQTSLAPFIKDTAEGREADAILRKCTHCGMCTATCPTYQLLGDELDGPRGRIYLIKQVLEGTMPTAKTQLHLDRCLTCRACETTCPTGVRYGRLVDIGRHVVEERVARGPIESAWRGALNSVISNASLFGPLLKMGQLTRPLLPSALKRKVPPAAAPAGPWPAATHARKMLVLDGCAQPSLSPATNAAAARVLDRLGISLVRVAGAGCCGGVSFHLNLQDKALGVMRRTIDAWWPHIEQGAEAIVIAASGCGVTVKEYGHYLAQDSAYAAKARRVAELARDIGEVVISEKDRLIALVRQSSADSRRRQVAFHAPCTLQHGLKLAGRVEELLASLGYSLTQVPDSHLCCGSAGTYSILQPALSKQLLANKIAALEGGQPAAILTANIGCQVHLQTATSLPVRHWIEALDDALNR